MNIKWYGNATLIVDDGSQKILFDPFFSYTEKREYYKKQYLPFFKSCDAIVLTHGHFDHIHDVPEILKAKPMPVYCTKVPSKTLIRKGVDEKLIHRVSAGENFSIGNFLIKAHKGKHASFGLPLILKTACRKVFWKNVAKATKIGMQAIFDEKEGGETLIFEVINNNKTLVVMGSMGLAKKTLYPRNIDMIALPYQGRSDLVDFSFKIFEKIKPKKALLDHYDSYAPPISMEMDTRKLVNAVKDRGYEIKIIVAQKNILYNV